ncbi:MAG: glycerol-3-phosphate responsive antiterminator [Clostridia bacterium]|nr:glycerol-3-phosphate responsive antiterminator [Clostridia bacterium]
MNESLIIAAVKNEAEFQAALASDVKLIFHLVPNIMTLQDNIKQAHSSGKSFFIHLDLAEGIAKDKFGVKYVKTLGVDGIITTRANIVKFAKEEKLFTVQRFFILDSRSVEAIFETLKSSKPDMIEIMPGVVPKIISRLKERLTIPIIAGGLIETKDEVQAIFNSGAKGVSTGKKTLW